MGFVIITDSSCDLNKELRDRFNIPEYIPGLVTFPDGHTEDADLDYGSITPKEYYDSMKPKKVLYKTGYGSSERTIATFEKYIEMGYDVLAITLSHMLSGTYQGFAFAAGEVNKKYPDRKVMVVDSYKYSAGIAALIVKAAELRDAGKSVEETAKWLEENRNCLHQMGIMDDMYFLCKTGRVSNFKAFFGTLAGINTLADFNPQGIPEVIGKTKGKRDAVKAIIEYVKAEIIDPENQICFVSDADRPESADLLEQAMRDNFNFKEIIRTKVGMSCGASIGPGMAAVYFFGKPLSADYSEEKQLMDNILADIKKK